jgi:hypothetical protein
VNAPRSRHNPPTDPSDDGLIRGWGRFWFTPTLPTGLHAVRLAAGLLFLFWLLPFAGHIDSLFSLNGWFDTDAYVQGHAPPNMSPEEKAAFPEEANRGPLDPIISSWSLIYLKGIGDNPQVLAGVYWASVMVFALLALGVATRVTAVLTWIAVASFTANPAIRYDGDSFLLVFAFYLMVGYVLLGQRNANLSWLDRLLGTSDTFLLRWLFGRSAEGPRPSLAANLAVRLLQVHFAIIMVTSGLHKLQFGDSWAGYSLWYASYPVGTTIAEAREHAGDRAFHLFFLSAAAYAGLFWQIGFPLFAWRKAWRPIVLIGGVIGWLVNSFFFEHPLMGPALFIGCLSFVGAEEWQRLFSLLSRVPGLAWLAPPERVEPEDRTEEAPVEKKETSNYITVGHR